MKKMTTLFFIAWLASSMAQAASVSANSDVNADLAAIQDYGMDWNTGNVQGILDHFVDGADFVYTDALVSPNVVNGKQSGGIRNKSDLKEYANSVFKVYPKQIWNDSVEVFMGSTPGSYAIYYHFSLFRDAADTVPAFTGTGMENIQMDANHKIVREEIHLSFSQGQVDTSLFLGIPNFYRNVN